MEGGEERKRLKSDLQENRWYSLSGVGTVLFSVRPTWH